MLRVVLDTNVLVSAIISDGKPRQLFRKGIKSQFIVLTSDLMLKELARVLRRPKFKTSPSEIRRITLALLISAEVVGVKSKLKVVRDDPEDLGLLFHLMAYPPDDSYSYRNPEDD